MKVLHVIPSVSPLRGGPSFALRDMARGLVQAGIEVHIATTDDNGPDGHLDVPLGQPVVNEGVTCWYFRRQTRFYAVSWPLTRWLAQHINQFDLVHIHALFSYASLPTAWYAFHRNVPYIVRPLGVLNRWGITQRRPLMKQISLWLFERHILHHAAAVHFTTQQEQDEAEVLGIPMRPVLLPLGIDLTPFTRLPPSGTFRRNHPHLADKTLLLFLSRLDKKKGLDLLLPAFAQVHQHYPDVALVLAGSGEPTYETWLREQVQALGITEAVVFTGFLAGEQKLAILADCDIFVLPSYSENFGVVVVEAMACGLPVIVSEQVGLVSEVRNAGAGLVVPCQPSHLADALATLLSNPTQRQQMAARAKELAQQRFSLEASSQAFVQVYRQLIPVSEKEQGL